MDESLEMLRLLVADGARTIVATSHIYPGRYPNEPDDLRRRFAVLCEAAQRAAIPVELDLGAEHYLDEHLLVRVRAGKCLAFGTERYVLFETHTGSETPVGLLDVVYELAQRGFTPLLAHVERYQWLRGSEGQELCFDLRAAGARFQVNRTVGKINRPGIGPRGRFISELIERGWIDEVGSDLHRPTAEGRPYVDPPLDAADTRLPTTNTLASAQ